MQVPDDAVKITDNTVTISLKNVSVVDQIRFPGGTGNNLGVAGSPATLSFDITYSKSGATRHVEPTSADPLSPFNWAGEMTDATNSGTFSVAYNDGTFSVQGSFDSTGMFGQIGFERNGAFVRDELARLSATQAAPSPAQNQPNAGLAQNTLGAQQSPNEPKFRGTIPIRELIH